MKEYVVSEEDWNELTEMKIRRDKYGYVSAMNIDPPEPSTGPDMVNHPAHYTHATLPNGEPLECITVIEALGLPYHLGNVLKYIWRWDHKGDPVESLEKASWYLQRYISLLKDNE